MRPRSSEAMMPLDWSAGALAEGLRCYRGGEFFAAHEHWEEVWLTLEGPEKTFLQGLIQITAAFHHWQRGNRAGTESLLTAALSRLEPLPTEFGGVRLNGLRDEMRCRLAVLRQGGGTEAMPFPVISILTNDNG